MKNLILFLAVFSVTCFGVTSDKVWRIPSGGSLASWGPVNLSAGSPNAVTGQLPIANGGTGGSAFTLGSVVFAGASALSQDNANLFWDNTNKRLGIGNAAPATALHVTGTARLGNNVNVAANSISLSSGALSVSATTITLSPTSASLTLSSSSAIYVGTGGSVALYTGYGGGSQGGFLYESGNRMQIKNVAEITVNSSVGDVVVVGTRLGGNLLMGRFYSHAAGLATLQLPGLSGSEATPNSAGMRADGTIVRESSSARYKTDIENIEVDTSKIYDLRPVSFRWKAHPEKAQKDVGLIAEEVFNTIPELAFVGRIDPVSGKYDATKPEIPESVHYKLLPVLMLQEMKKLKNRVDFLESSCLRK
jgi:hypothetical protein